LGYIVLAFGFSFETGGRNAFIDELYVAPEHRGKGIARRARELSARRKKQESRRSTWKFHVIITRHSGYTTAPVT
jgi:GNAT superfamily N-acetyltransferase